MTPNSREVSHLPVNTGVRRQCIIRRAGRHLRMSHKESHVPINGATPLLFLEQVL